MNEMPVETWGVLSLKHTERGHRWITLWRPNRANYAWPLEWAGQYSSVDVVQHRLNDGYSGVACRWDHIERLSVAAEVDGQAVRCLPNTREVWTCLLASGVIFAKPEYRPAPQHKGARLGRGMHRWPPPKPRREMDFEVRAYLAEHRRKKRGIPSAQEVRQAEALAKVEAFNASTPIGSPVRYWSFRREGDGVLSRTRSAAHVKGESAVVWVEGYTSWIALSHVEPVVDASVVFPAESRA